MAGSWVGISGSKMKNYVMFQCMACACIRIWGDPGDQFLWSPWLVLPICREFWPLDDIYHHLVSEREQLQALPRGVCLQQERFLEIWERQYWSIHALLFEDIECLKSLGDNSMGSDFLSLLSPLIKSYKGAAICVNPLMKGL